MTRPIPVGEPAKTDIGAVEVQAPAVPGGHHVVRLPLTAAGRRLLEATPRPRLAATAVTHDRVYSRSVSRTARLRLR